MAVRKRRRPRRAGRRQSAGRGAPRAAPISRASSAARPAATARRPPTLALDGDWRDRAELGEVYLAAVTHAYGGVERAAPQATTSAAASPRPTCWSIRRTIASATCWTATASPTSPAASPPPRRCWATSPSSTISTPARPATPKARRIAEEIARVVRGRLTNPRWLAGMLDHGHRGVAEIAQSVDALYAFAATAAPCPAICSMPRMPR